MSDGSNDNTIHDGGKWRNNGQSRVSFTGDEKRIMSEAVRYGNGVVRTMGGTDRVSGDGVVDRNRGATINSSQLYSHGHSLSLQQRQHQHDQQQRQLHWNPQLNNQSPSPRQQQQEQQQQHSNRYASITCNHSPVHGAATAAYDNNGHGGHGSYTHKHARNDSAHITSSHQAATSHQGSPSRTTATPSQQHHFLEMKRRRVRSVLSLAALAFGGILVLDGLMHFTDLSTTVHKGVYDAADIIDDYERRLVNGQLQSVPSSDDGSPGFFRRLLDVLLDDLLEESDSVPPPHRSYSDLDLDSHQQDQELDSNRQDHDTVGLMPDLGYGDGDPEALVFNQQDYDTFGLMPDLGDDNDGTTTVQTRPSPPQTGTRAPLTLHILPLLPKHSLQHRQRRELIAKQLPIPEHLQEGQEDEMYHAENAHRRRRMYPVLQHEDGEDGGRMLKQDGAEGDSSLYETGALYQGYGTHYLDLWVGSPTPQRQTVIIDTGSSITAFPCTGCVNCGSNPATGKRYHLDEDYDVELSGTYEEKVCDRGKRNAATTKVTGRVGCDLGTCQQQHCQLAVSYAEGSSWTAREGSDVVYPSGPHDAALGESQEELQEGGVGVAMGNLLDGSLVEDEEGEGKEFDWMDFRLKFGCESKVTGQFRSQLEDGIMGMDNRKGSFWLQLYEHYKRNGYVAGDNDDADVAFDPNQFSLCYDRQPPSMDLTLGVGSGALTLGGTDPLLHNTDMVFAENITPLGGWYAVRIKAMFLLTKGGTLAQTHKGPNAVHRDYVRVNAQENILNGSPNEGKGVIVDSGTTDTYLPQAIKAAFERAWTTTLSATLPSYHNNPVKMTPGEVESLPTILLVLKGHSPSNENNNESAVGMTRSHEGLFKAESRGSGEKKGQSISNSDVVVAIPPTHYMEASGSHPGKYTARIYFTERFGAQPILGSNFMMGHEVNFDVGRGRIGFAESHCDYSRYVQERDEAAAKQQQQQEEEQMGQVEKESRTEGDNSQNSVNDEGVENSEHGAINEEDGSSTPNINSDLAASGWARS